MLSANRAAKRHIHPTKLAVGKRLPEPLLGPAGSLIQMALPKGTPLEAEVAIRRLIELVGTLPRRAAQLQEVVDSRIVIEQAKGGIRTPAAPRDVR